MAKARYETSPYGLPLFWGIVIGLVAVACMLLAMFVDAILWAAVLSILTFPVYKALKDKVRLKFRGQDYGPSTAASLTVLFALLVILLPFALLGTVATAQAKDLIEGFEASHPNAESGEDIITILAADIDRAAKEPLARIGVDNFSVYDYARNNSKEIGQNVAKPLGNMLKKTLIGILSLVIALFTMWFMLKDGHMLIKPTANLIPLPRDETMAILKRLHMTVQQVARGIVLVAMIQGLIAGIIFAFAGVDGAVLFGFLVFIMACIPLLGPPTVYIPICLSILFGGEPGKALAVFLANGIFTSQIDNILRPVMIQANLHPIGLFFALIGGVLFFGPVGVMAGPMLLALLVAISEILQRRRALLEEGYDLDDAPPALRSDAEFVGDDESGLPLEPTD